MEKPRSQRLSPRLSMQSENRITRDNRTMLPILVVIASGMFLYDLRMSSVILTSVFQHYENYSASQESGSEDEYIFHNRENKNFGKENLVHTLENKIDEEIRVQKMDEEEFATTLWPELREKLCPAGNPNLSLGPTLFKMGREEFGIPAHSTFPKAESKIKPSKFFDGIFELTLFMDGNDRDNSMLYPSIWKCANNQIHTYLEIVTNRDVIGEVKDENSPFGHSNDTMAWRLNRVHKLEKLLADGDEENEESENNFREKPCVFTVIRDPIKRVLSGYNEVDYRLITGQQLAVNSQNMERPPYTKIPGYSLNHTGFRASQNILEKRFETFVRNLVREHPSISKQNNVFRHIHPMSKILPTLRKLDLLPAPHKDGDDDWFLPMTANFTQILPEFIAKTCPRLANIYDRDESDTNNIPYEFPGFPPVPYDGQHESSNDPFGTYEAAKAVVKKGGPAARALCNVYAFDYACFYNGNKNDEKTRGGSPRLGVTDIPSICREVYASDMFRNTVCHDCSFATTKEILIDFEERLHVIE